MKWLIFINWLSLSSILIVQCQYSTDLKAMIFYRTERNSNDYLPYGCWCGTDATTSLLEKTIDETDLCCKLHSICYDEITEAEETCGSKRRYQSIFSDDQIQCIDHDGTQQRATCLCDRQLAYCLQRALPTYNIEKKLINSTEICEPDAPTLIWDSDGITLIGTTGAAGSSDRLLNLPFSLIVQSNTTIYVSDQNNHRVQKWTIGESSGVTVAGQSNGELGSTSKHFSRPGGLAIDHRESLYVADINNHRIQAWNNSSIEGTTIAGMTGSPGAELNQLNNPFGIARNPRTGVIYIADRDNHRVVSYQPNSSVGTIVAGGNGAGIGRRQLHSPIGLYYDVFTDSLLIVNYGVHNIVRWKLGEDNWTLVVGSLAGISGTSSTLLNHPIGVTMDRWKNIYVADTSNHRVQFFQANQINGTTIAGITASPGSGVKQLRYPFALALDNQLNLYVSDSYNHRIQKYSRLHHVSPSE